MADFLSLKQAANAEPGCKFSLVGPNFYNFGLGFSLPQGSPWLEEVSLAVLKLQNGTVLGIEKHWFDRTSCTRKVSFKDFSVNHFSGLFFGVIFGVALCSVFLLLEWIILFVACKYTRFSWRYGRHVISFLFNVRASSVAEVDDRFAWTTKNLFVAKSPVISPEHNASVSHDDADISTNRDDQRHNDEFLQLERSELDDRSGIVLENQLANCL